MGKRRRKFREAAAGVAGGAPVLAWDDADFGDARAARDPSEASRGSEDMQHSRTIWLHFLVSGRLPLYMGVE